MPASLSLPAHLDLVAAAPLRSDILARRGRPLDLDSRTRRPRSGP